MYIVGIGIDYATGEKCIVRIGTVLVNGVSHILIATRIAIA
jgi:hypothetical protein